MFRPHRLKCLLRCENVAVVLIAHIMLKKISVREMHATDIKNTGRLTFSRKILPNFLKLDALK